MGKWRQYLALFRPDAGRLDLATQAEIVRGGVGQSGENPEYLRNTVLHLRDVGIHDADLEALFELLE